MTSIGSPRGPINPVTENPPRGLSASMSAFLASRRLLPELMDAPDLGAQEHRRALAGLARLNAASRTASQLVHKIAELAIETPGEPLRVLDVASGGGDVAIGVARRLRARGLDVEVLGVDMSPTAVQRANQAADGVAGVRFEQHDALSGPLPAGYDVVTSSLFLHHLTDEQTVALLRRCAAASPAMVISDLVRGRLGYGLAQLACRTLSRSPVVHYDGPQSVVAAYTVQEMMDLLAAAGLPDASVTRCWPERMMITWRQPHSPSAPGADAS